MVRSLAVAAFVASAFLPTPIKAQASEDCREKASATERLVTDLNTDATGGTTSTELVDGGPNLARLPPELAIDVEIDETGRLTLWGRSLDGDQAAAWSRLVSEERGKLRQLRGASAQVMPDPSSRPLVIAIHWRAPWSAVVKAINARPEGDERVRLLFKVPQRTHTPKATWVREAAEGKALPERTKVIADASAKLASSCPTYQRLLTRLRKTAAANMAAELEGGIAEALIGCSCRTDIPALHDLLYITLQIGKPVGYVELLIPRGNGGEPVEAPASARFSEIAPKLLKASKRGVAIAPQVSDG